MNKMIKQFLVLGLLSVNVHALNVTKVTHECENKNYKMCSALGTLYFSGIGVEKNITKSIAYNMIACRGDDDYCKQFTKILKWTKRAPLDDKQFFYYSKVACGLNDAKSCYFVGNHFSNYKTIPNNKSAMKFYEKSCSLGYEKGCYKAGMAYYNGALSNKDIRKGLNYLQKSCDENLSLACFNLGVAYEKGLGIDANRTQAVLNYQKSCKLNYVPACFNLALTHEKEINKEYRKIRKLLEKTCKSKEGIGCYDLANIYMLGNGVSINYDKARNLYKKSCGDKNANSCNNLGFIYEHGLGVDSNYTKAKMYYKKACTLGYKKSCMAIKLLPADTD